MAGLLLGWALGRRRSARDSTPREPEDRPCLLILSACFAVYCPVGTGADTRSEVAAIRYLAPKGRVQDREYNPSIETTRVVHSVVTNWQSQIPSLIEMLEDDTLLPDCHIDYWRSVHLGDLALFFLTDLFRDSSWQDTTIPGGSWEEMLEAAEQPAATGEFVLRDFVAKKGRRALKEKWLKIWTKYKGQIYWNEEQRCFAIRAGAGQRQ